MSSRHAGFSQHLFSAAACHPAPLPSPSTSLALGEAMCRKGLSSFRESSNPLKQILSGVIGQILLSLGKVCSNLSAVT